MDAKKEDELLSDRIEDTKVPVVAINLESDVDALGRLSQ